MPSRLVLLILLLGPQTSAFSQNWNQVRSSAERQHEMVMLLIRNGDFGRVLVFSFSILFSEVAGFPLPPEP